MKAGEVGSTWKAAHLARVLPVLLLLSTLAGCVLGGKARIEKNLLADRPATADRITERYRVGCPDVLEIVIARRPEFSGSYTVRADGRIDLGDYGKLHVDGQPPAEIARLIGEETGTDAAEVQVRVAQFRSQYVLLFGQVIGWQRSVAYEGPEVVLDLLKRVGGITPGAEPSDIYVVRSHLADNGRPEVFHVDLEAILMKHDDRTNVRLLPFDQVYVGETRQAQFQNQLPPWLRSLVQRLSDTRPRPTSNAPTPVRSRWISGSNPDDDRPFPQTPEPPRAGTRAEGVAAVDRWLPDTK